MQQFGCSSSLGVGNLKMIESPRRFDATYIG
jgi:hypothetical protein